MIFSNTPYVYYDLMAMFQYVISSFYVESNQSYSEESNNINIGSSSIHDVI